MTIFFLYYTLTVGTHYTNSQIEFTSLSECLKEKDRIEQYYLELPDDSKSLNITCRSINEH